VYLGNLHYHLTNATRRSRHQDDVVRSGLADLKKPEISREAGTPERPHPIQDVTKVEIQLL